MNSEKHTKYDVNLEKGTTEWVGEKMANELNTIDKRKKSYDISLFCEKRKTQERLSPVNRINWRLLIKCYIISVDCYRHLWNSWTIVSMTNAMV